MSKINFEELSNDLVGYLAEGFGTMATINILKKFCNLNYEEIGEFFEPHQIERYVRGQE